MAGEGPAAALLAWALEEGFGPERRLASLRAGTALVDALVRRLLVDRQSAAILVRILRTATFPLPWAAFEAQLEAAVALPGVKEVDACLDVCDAVLDRAEAEGGDAPAVPDVARDRSRAAARVVLDAVAAVDATASDPDALSEALIWARTMAPRPDPTRFQQANAKAIAGACAARRIAVPGPTVPAKALRPASAFVHSDDRGEVVELVRLPHVALAATGAADILTTVTAAEALHCRALALRELSLSPHYVDYLGYSEAPPLRTPVPRAPVAAFHALAMPQGERVDQLVTSAGRLDERSPLAAFLRARLLDVCSRHRWSEVRLSRGARWLTPGAPAPSRAAWRRRSSTSPPSARSPCYRCPRPRRPVRAWGSATCSSTPATRTTSPSASWSTASPSRGTGTRAAGPPTRRCSPRTSRTWSRP